MRKARPARMPWLIGLGLSTAMFVLLFIFADMYFAANDDKTILRAFMGFQPGGAVSFHIYVHGLFAYPLHWLGTLFPGVAWFTVLQIALLWFANAVIIKSILMCTTRARQPLWLGLVVSMAYLLLFGMYNGARITYTVTAATLGAAAVAQILSVDIGAATDKQVVCRMSLATVLVALCYALRQMAVLPALAFCGIAFMLRFATCFCVGKGKQRSYRPLVATLAIVAVVLCGQYAFREIDIDAQGMREYATWDRARISVLDYIDLDSVDESAYQEAGFTATQVELLENWYTMDESYSVQAFEAVHEKAADVRPSPGAALLDLRTRSPLMVRSFICLCVLGAICVLLLLGFHKGKRLYPMLALVFTGLLCFALFCYLALQGRLPYRAVLVPVLPAAAIVLCMLPACMPACDGAFKRFHTVRLVAGLLVVALSLGCGVPMAYSIRYVPPKWAYNTFEDLDHQGLSHPDLLLIYNNDMVNDLRLFPDTSDGMPTNVMFWGGWERGSQEYEARLAAFGLDGDHFTPDDWLKPFMRHVTVSPEPYEPLLTHLREQVDERVEVEREQLSEGLYAYRFYIPGEG